MFSFEEIVNEIDLKRATARTGVDSWDRLRSVASELAGAPATGESWHSADKTWCLEKVSIHGYRGVSNDDPLVLAFDPTPGITVLHGLNGAGKSSVSDAIDIGLTGRTPPVAIGTAGKAPLWEPIQLARGSTSAHIEVTLSARSERLVISTLLGSNGTVQSHDARIENSEGARQTTLDASWHQALASYQPVFAYAALERRVQLSKDLATYFEGLLALGGSFTALQETIVERGESSAQALSRWRSAKDEAMHSVRQIDEERGADTKVTPLDPVIVPDVEDDRNEWLRNAGLLEEGVHSHTLPGDTRAQPLDAATRVQDSILKFERAGTASEQHLSGALESLHSEAIDRHIDSDACPVCTTLNSNWLALLGETVKGNNNLSVLRKAVDTNTRALASATEGLLVPVLKVGALAEVDDPIRVLSSTAQHLLEKFCEVRNANSATQHSVLTATSELSTWLGSSDAGILVDEAVARTDANKQWRIARARAVESFATVWKKDGASAAESVLWSQTAKRVEEIRNQLRKRRSASLEGKAGARIKSLLSDAQLHLKSISVSLTKASMDLVDQNDNAVDLGMLSAGQRNAVLLAPLLASVDAGPFGFLILDDPVHAFDELRIDRLAETLAKLAETRRVIVLTHDDRLKEHLAARSIQCDTRLVDRSSSTGAIEISDSSQFWHELLNDAGQIHDLAATEAGSTQDVTDAVRRLCRMAIDNALRTFTLRNAVLFNRHTTADLEALDAVYTTEKRLHVAKSFWPGPSEDNPVTRAIQVCEHDLEAWNQSAHGNPHTSNVSRKEIKSARKACKALVALP